MTDWRPVAELQSLLDALESELLSASDAEICEMLGRGQASRAALLAIIDATAMPDALEWRPAAAGPRVCDRHVSPMPWFRGH